MNASHGLLNRTLTWPGCCNVSAAPSTNDAFGAPFMDDRQQFIMCVVQIAVLCVLSLTVVFGIFFLACNLLIKSQSMIHLLVEDRRPSKEAEIMTA
ncbi:reprimo, TP53 dependent G2 arrest mediator homolog 3 [Brachyhypopomus gauderio]|uniref:reprimo, TP53 dependent G2 arrest mediator homolog 3 n=1 Tax=Brachyhypopomus gauderio TaxID=698409 RepID=UPI00404190A0